MKCFDVYKSPTWSTFFLVVTLANSIYIAVLPELQTPDLQTDSDSPRGATWLDTFDFITAAVLFFEVTTGIVALGFAGRGGTWLMVTDFHKLDLFVLFVTLTEYLFNYGFGIRGVTMRPFRLLRVFRAITRIRAFSGIKTIIITLKQGLPQLMIVFSMLLFFCACFSIFGIAIFQKSFSRRCVSLPHPIPAGGGGWGGGWAPECDFSNPDAEVWGPGGEEIVTGGYPFVRFCDIITNTTPGEFDLDYPLDPYDKFYHTCGMENFEAGLPVYQTCVRGDNPSNGFSHYDSIGGAMLSIFQAISLDAYYDVLWRSLESEPILQPVTWVFYFLITSLCSFLLLGLFVAIVTGTFTRVRSAHGSAFLSHEEEGEKGGLEAMQEQGLGVMKSMVKSINKLTATYMKPEGRTKDGKLVAYDDQEESEVQVYCMRLVEHPRFVHFYSLIIILNSIALASDQYDASPTWRQFSYYVYLVTCGLHWVETSVRFVAAGDASRFLQKRMHRSELMINTFTTIGLVSEYKALILLPAFRIYRLMTYLPTLEALLQSALASVRAIANLVIFIIIVAICFCVTGRYLFGVTMDGITRSNFGTFEIGMLTIFQVLTGDSWSSVLYSAMSTKTSILAQLFAALFMCTWFIFSRLIVWNLFVAVIIENFQVTDTIKHIQQPGYVANVRDTVRVAYMDMLKQSQGALKNRFKVVDAATGEMGVTNANNFDDRVPTRGGTARTEPTEIVQVGGARGGGKMAVKVRKKKAGSKGKDFRGYQLKGEELLDTETVAGNSQFAEDKPHEDTALMRVAYRCTPHEQTRRAHEEEEDQQGPNTVLYCLGPTNPIRKTFIWLGDQFLFELIVFVCIITSCVFLMITPPNLEAPGTVILLDESVMNFWNDIFTFVFTVEFFVRVMAQGLLLTPKAYLKSGWNRTDFIVLFFAWIEWSGLLQEGRIVKVARLARALRPLRLMKRNAGMRIVIDALICTLVPVSYVIIFSIFTFMVFALIGQGLFGGLLFRCTTPGAEYPAGKAECSGFHVVDAAFMVPRTWENAPYNFDSFYDSIFLLFRVNTIKYVGIIFRAMDITQINQSQLENNSKSSALFFIVYLFIGALFVMNLFVGFIIDGFNANKGSSDADVWYGRFNRQIATYKPKYDRFPAPQNALSGFLRGIVTSKYFELFSASCVFVNLGFMLADHAYAEQWFIDVMDIQNTIFFGELVAEVLINTWAYGPGGFVNDPWKAFDLFVALGTGVGYFANSPRVSTFVKSFRILRVIRLMKMIKPIRVIMETLIICLPQLLNILVLLFLVYSMFAVVAVQQYGLTRYGWRVGPTANFDTWPHAMATSYQMVTGDEWQDIMVDLSIAPPSCTEIFRAPEVYGWAESGWQNYSFGDCGSAYTRFYFVAFMLVCQNIMLNLFIGMILDNFSFITDDVATVEDENWSTGSSADQVVAMARAFQKFDAGTGYMAINALHGYMMTISRPLGFRDAKGRVEITDEDRAAELLVRAEINVFVRTEIMQANEIRTMGWRKFFRIGSLRTGHGNFSCSIGFEALMRTLLYWRKPDMVPDNVLVARYERCEEVLFMAKALTTMEFFRMLVSRRKQRKTVRMIHERTAFRTWAAHDNHRRRRSVQRAAQLAEEKEALSAHQKTHDEVAIPFSEIVEVELEPVDYVPEDMVEHQEAVLRTKVKYPKPVHGIEVFNQRSKNELVVLRFLDPNNQKYGILLADLTGCKWTSWVLRNMSHDSFFEPHTHSIQKGPAFPWMRLDLSLKQGSSMTMRAKKRFGSVIDISSCVESTQSTEGNRRPTDPVSIVRINVGMHRLPFWMDHRQGMVNLQAGKEKDLFAEACMEVVGYLPTSFAGEAQKVQQSPAVERFTSTAAEDLDEETPQNPGM